MADYIDIDAPIDVAVYQCNRRIQVTLRQILDSNDVKYQTADVRPVVLCRDCAIPHNNWTGCPKLNGTLVRDEDFCSHGIKSVCDGCKTCEYFQDERWNCQGEKATCTHYTANFYPNHNCGADMREES